MIADQLRNAIRAQPVVPFTLVLAGNQPHRIDRPEIIAMSISGRLAWVIHPDET